jgi:hypothetical protein
MRRGGLNECYDINVSYRVRQKCKQFLDLLIYFSLSLPNLMHFDFLLLFCIFPTFSPSPSQSMSHERDVQAHIEYSRDKLMFLLKCDKIVCGEKGYVRCMR